MVPYADWTPVSEFSVGNIRLVAQVAWIEDTTEIMSNGELHEVNRQQEGTLQQVLNTLSPDDQKHIEQVGAG